jgi:hypothetical protein
LLEKFSLDYNWLDTFLFYFNILYI